MSTTEHTAGPWEYVEYANGQIEVIADGDVGGVVHQGQIFTEADDIAEERANARLIAAAPQLLAACRGLLMHIALEAYDRISAKDEAVVAAQVAIAAYVEYANGQIAAAESPRCPRCEGNGRLWADGKAHYPSEQRDTIACGNCGGSGYLQSENAKDIAIAAAAPQLLAACKSVVAATANGMLSTTASQLRIVTDAIAAADVKQ